jgi:lysozyme
VLDVEATPTSPTCHRHLTQNGAIADMKVMLDEMERHYGKRPIIYTTVDFYEAILSDGAFADYPIWVRSTKHHPAVKYGSRAWAFWQYQSDGQTPGINGAVDRDVFYGTQDQWRAFLGEPKRRLIVTRPPPETAAAQSPSPEQAVDRSSDESPEAPQPAASGAQ